MVKKTKTKTSSAIKFDERLHKYTYEGKELESVTTWIERTFFVPFKHENRHIYIMNNMVKSNKKKGMGITNADDLAKSWRLKGKRASKQGDVAHMYVEYLHLLKQYGQEPERLTGYDDAAHKAYYSLIEKWDIIELEKQVYSIKYGLAGTLDVLMKNKKTGKLGILDWKSIADIIKPKTDTKDILKHVSPKFNGIQKASIQIDVYNEIGGFDIEPENRFVVQLCSDGKYNIYGGTQSPLPIYTDIVKNQMNNNVVSQVSYLDYV